MATEPQQSVMEISPIPAHPPWTVVSSAVPGLPSPTGPVAISQNGSIAFPNGFPNSNFDFDMLSIIMQLQRICPPEEKDDLTHAMNIIGYSPTVRVCHQPDRAGQIAEAYRKIAKLADTVLNARDQQVRLQEQEQRRMSYQVVNMPNISPLAAPQTNPSGSFGVLNMRGNYPTNHFPAAPHQRTFAPPVELPTFSFVPMHVQQYTPLQLPTPIPTPQSEPASASETSPKSPTLTPKKIKLTWKGKAEAEAAANGQVTASKRKRKSNGVSKKNPKSSDDNTESASPAEEEVPSKKARVEEKKGPAGWVPYSVDEFLRKD